MFAPALLFTWLAGCAGPGLSPSVDLREDGMAAALPSDTTLLFGGDLRSLGEAPFTEALLTRAGMEIADLDAAVLAAGGPAAGARAVDEVRIGCGDAGCAALLEGDFAGTQLTGARLTAARFDGLPARGKPAPGKVPGVDAVGSAGQRYSLRVLSGEKAVLGDRAAVRAVRKSGSGGAGLDVSRFDGDVPAGDLWVVAWDLERLVEQAARRAERGAPGAGDALRERVAEAVAKAPVPLADIATVALSVALGVEREDPVEARLRVRCHDEGAALTLAIAMEVAAARAPAAGAEPLEVTVARVGPVVEAVGTLGTPALLALLEGG
jgi:hypothetical protein